MLIKNKKLSYIAEINLCSTSAYKHQVLKMCDAFSELGLKVTLYIISNSNISFHEIKKKHLLKNRFKIEPLFEKKKNLNFILRMIFFLKLLNKKKIKDSIVYSRSVLISIFFSIIFKKNFLEIHQENYGLTKLIFEIFKKNILKKINFIFITKNLNRVFCLPSHKFLVAEDGVDIRDFNFKKLKKNYELRNSCVYTGSLHKGKGFEFIYKLAKINKNIKFFVYGDTNTANKKVLHMAKKLKNLYIMGHVNYCEIPRILSNYSVILMPYEKKVFGNHKSANLANFMSPLKMFDYLASKKIIISSRNQNIERILRNNYNSLICNKHVANEWNKKIIYAMNNKKLKKILGRNSYRTAKQFTWRFRAIKILNFINTKNN